MERPGQLSRYNVPGIESRWGRRFSTPVQTGPGSHPASYTMRTGSFPGVNRPGRGVDHPPLLAPRLKKEQICTSTPPLGFCALFQGDLYLYLYISILRRLLMYAFPCVRRDGVRETGGIALVLLNLGTRLRLVVSFTLLLFYPSKESPLVRVQRVAGWKSGPVTAIWTRGDLLDSFGSRITVSLS